MMVYNNHYWSQQPDPKVALKWAEKAAAQGGAEDKPQYNYLHDFAAAKAAVDALGNVPVAEPWQAPLRRPVLLQVDAHEDVLSPLLSQRSGRRHIRRGTAHQAAQRLDLSAGTHGLGTYSVTGNTLKFTATYLHGKADYEGTIGPDSLQLTWYVHWQFWKERGHIQIPPDEVPRLPPLKPIRVDQPKNKSALLPHVSR